MGGFIRGLLWGLVLIGAGWLGGSIFPAPSAMTAPIAQRAPDLAARLGIDDVSLDRLGAYMSAEQLAHLRREASALAAQAGEAVVIERDDAALQNALAALEDAPVVVTPISTAPAASASTAATPNAFESVLTLCPGMRVSNAPTSDAQRRVTNYAPLVSVNGVTIATNPTRGACLSSAYGPRGRGHHRGVDIIQASAGRFSRRAKARWSSANTATITETCC